MNKNFNYFETERSVIPHDTREDVYYRFFSKQIIQYISDEITKRLGPYKHYKTITVPREQIVSVMDSIWKNTYRDVDKMIMMTISYIVNYVRDDFDTIEKNNNLNIWVTSFRPEFGLQQHSKIKLREKRPSTGYFQYNY